jgi:hypothetical protein
MSEPNGHSLRRALDALVFAPLGAGLRAVEAAPGFVDACAERGRLEVDLQRAHAVQTVRNARVLGQYAWQRELPKLLARAEGRVDGVRRAANQFLAHNDNNGFSAPQPASSPRSAPEPTVAAPTSVRPPDLPRRPAPPPPSVPAPEPAHVPVARVNGNDAAARAELPIPGYDALSASQVVERLTGLADEELDAVRDYETTHRNRRTILGKIEQLAAPGA